MIVCQYTHVRAALAIGLLALVGAGVVLLVRRGDGPVEGLPGVALDREVVTDAAVDWSFATDLESAALQTTNPPRSRMVWILVHEGLLYVPSGFTPKLRWPRLLARYPVVLLRIQDRLYIRTAVRISDPARLHVLWEALGEKYGTPTPDSLDGKWMFRMDPFDPNA